MRRALAAMVAALAFSSPGAWAQSAEVANPDPKTEQRLKELANELRCLVCQNQTIADSNAPLAVDLRRQIRGQIAQGRSDSEILDYMVQRYGDFVLYRPPLKATTVLLWLGPLLLILGGAAIFVRVVRSRRPGAAGEIPPGKKADLAKLLEKD